MAGDIVEPFGGDDLDNDDEESGSDDSSDDDDDDASSQDSDDDAAGRQVDSDERVGGGELDRQQVDESTLNLDITAMIAYVSALTNGRQQFIFKVPEVAYHGHDCLRVGPHQRPPTVHIQGTRGQSYFISSEDILRASDVWIRMF